MVAFLLTSTLASSTIEGMKADQTQETLEIAFRDQETREAVAVMLAAGCTAPEIWAWLNTQPRARVN